MRRLPRFELFSIAAIAALSTVSCSDSNGIGGGWALRKAITLPEAGAAQFTLVRDGVKVDELVKQWRFYEPDCVVYQTSRRAAAETVFAVCGDRTPVAVATWAAPYWTMNPEGLRRALPAHIENGVAVSTNEFVPIDAIRAAALKQPSFRSDWSAHASTQPVLTPSTSKGSADPTALVNAAALGKRDLVDALIRSGADVNAAPHDVTPLVAAAEKDDAAVIASLLAAGAKVNAADSTGATALMYAARSGSINASRALLAAGADRSLRDRDGKTAADYATAMKHPEVLEVLSVPKR